MGTYVEYGYERNSWVAYHQRRRQKGLSWREAFVSHCNGEGELRSGWRGLFAMGDSPLTLRFSMDINYEVRGDGFWDVLDGLSVVAFERCSGESLTGQLRWGCR